MQSAALLPWKALFLLSSVWCTQACLSKLFCDISDFRLGISAEDMRNQKLLEDELPFDPGCPVSSYWVGNVEQLVRSEEGLQMLQGGKFDASLDGKMGLTLVACF